MDKKSRSLHLDTARGFAILFVIIHHSFNIFTNSWSSPVEIPHVLGYEIIAKLFSSFDLSLLILISGYIFAIQYGKLDERKFSYKEFINKKIKRLLIPAFVFGILYCFFLGLKESVFFELYKILNGYGHLWYLVMIFWVFVFAFFLNSFAQAMHKRSILFCFVIFSIASLGFFLPKFFQVARAFTYLPIFYWGYFLYYKGEFVISYVEKNYVRVFMLFIGYFILYFILDNYFANAIEINAFEKYSFERFAISYLSWINRIVINFIGTTFFFVFFKYISSKYWMYSDFFRSMNFYSFGVYLIHQIVMMFLIWETGIMTHLSPFLLPFILFVSSISLSMVLTVFIKKTKYAKYI